MYLFYVIIFSLKKNSAELIVLFVLFSFEVATSNGSHRDICMQKKLAFFGFFSGHLRHPVVHTARRKKASEQTVLEIQG
jgi:hypothetical protein